MPVPSDWRSMATACVLVDTDAYDVVRVPRNILRRHEASFHKRSRVHSVQLAIGAHGEVTIEDVADGAACVVRQDVSMSACLRAYLLSDDTRLPRHNLFTTVAADPEDYETYVGEDVWTAGSRTQTSEEATTSPSRTNTNDSTAAAPPNHDASRSRVQPPPCGPAADVLVQWMQTALGRCPNGVVLCGKYGVATDCDWAVSSRSLVLSNERDIMTAMRMSTMFLEDLAVQDREWALDPRQPRWLIMSLEAAVATSGASEFRMFAALAPPLQPTTTTSSHNAAAPGVTRTVMLVGAQRVTDVCFPELAKWTPQEEDAAFDAMAHRILGNGGRGDEAHSIAHAVAAADCCCSLSASSAEGLVLAYDVLYDSVSLPIYVLSVKILVPCVSDGGGTTSSMQDNDDGDVGDDIGGSRRDGGQSLFCLFRDGHTFHAVCSERQDGSDVAVGGEQRSRRLYIAHDMSDLCAPPRPGHLPLDFFEGDLAKALAEGLTPPPAGVVEMLASMAPSK